MGKYATDQAFGGQRASIGREVVVAERLADEDGQLTGEVIIRAGKIDTIHVGADRPVICTWSGNVYHPDGAELTFVPCTTQAEVEALPADSWTWPARV
ncbi:hypothetical protein WMF30_10600 [Sorangium sp. So ce134]